MSSLLVFPVFNGDIYNQMAMDQVLFEHCLENKVFCLRVYKVREPSITIGYSQEFSDYHLSDCLWTRRISGGGVVYHGKDEVLMAVLPLPQSKRPLSSFYRLFHECILDSFQPSDQELFLLKEDQDCRHRVGLCFKEPVQYDISFKENKVLGGALKRRRDYVLYQGSLQGHRELSFFKNKGMARLIAKIEERFDLVPERINDYDKQLIQLQRRCSRFYQEDSWRKKRERFVCKGIGSGA